MSQSSHRVSLQPAYILHGRDFRDTSRLLDIFTQDYGRITLVAKGARSARSKLQGVLLPFTPLLISWSGKGDVQTLTSAESLKNDIHLSGKQIMSGYYINELLQRLMTSHDPHPEVFDIYQTTLLSFEKDNEEHVLRRFEKYLLAKIGYGLLLDTDFVSGDKIRNDAFYHYHLEHGPVVVKSEDNSDTIQTELVISGKTLLELSVDNLSCSQSKKEAKQLMRMVLNHHLGGKPLKTRNLHWYKPL
ncbi:MAG: DNA repair protein RecO [Woeseiaceae bacterium]